MGSLAVKNVEGSYVLQDLKPIWQEKPETARRLRGRLESVLGYATAHGYREEEYPARWKGHLSHLLGRVADRAVKHHAAMPFKDLPAFMAELKEREGAGARALELTILTAARTGEIIEAQWREFDLEESLLRLSEGGCPWREAIDALHRAAELQKRSETKTIQTFKAQASLT